MSYLQYILQKVSQQILGGNILLLISNLGILLISFFYLSVIYRASSRIFCENCVDIA